ncbi:hypothetical protein N9A96_00170 [bacterium]|nr:hypothetical protein [bacterium]MDA7909218.1 hypothetical protein [bacterium]
METYQYACHETDKRAGADFGFGASNRARLKAHPNLQDTDPFLDFLERQKAIAINGKF